MSNGFPSGCRVDKRGHSNQRQPPATIFPKATELLKSFQTNSVKHIPKEENTQVDALSKLAKKKNMTNSPR